MKLTITYNSDSYVIDLPKDDINDFKNDLISSLQKKDIISIPFEQDNLQKVIIIPNIVSHQSVFILEDLIETVSEIKSEGVDIVSTELEEDI